MTKGITHHGEVLPEPDQNSFKLKEIKLMEDFVVAREFEDMPDDEAYEIVFKKIGRTVKAMSFSMVSTLYAAAYEKGEI
ncbi:MAG: hypothetical protein KAX49_20645 [Halanaerobiales bacterium]|nr:hypothetical protein [Halanaerobiales bacterium]